MTLFRAEAGSPAIALGTLRPILSVWDSRAILKCSRATTRQAGSFRTRRSHCGGAAARAAINSFRTQGARAVTDELEVRPEADFLERLHVGTLSHDRGTLRFAYDPVWLKNPQAFALDPDFGGRTYFPNAGSGQLPRL